MESSTSFHHSLLLVAIFSMKVAMAVGPSFPASLLKTFICLWNLVLLIELPLRVVPVLISVVAIQLSQLTRFPILVVFMAMVARPP